MVYTVVTNLWELDGVVSKCGKYRICGSYGMQFINILGEDKSFIRMSLDKSNSIDKIKKKLKELNFDKIIIDREFEGFNKCVYCSKFHNCIKENHFDISVAKVKELIYACGKQCFEMESDLRRLVEKSDRV